MSFMSKVPRTRRDRHRVREQNNKHHDNGKTPIYRPASPGPGVGGSGDHPHGHGAPSHWPDGRHDSSSKKRPVPGPIIERSVPEPWDGDVSQSRIRTNDGRSTPIMGRRMNKARSVEELSLQLGDPDSEDEDQVVVMVMGKAMADGTFQMAPPPNRNIPNPNTSLSPRHPGCPEDGSLRPRGSMDRLQSVGSLISAPSGMPDEVFYPTGGGPDHFGSGPRLTSSRLSHFNGPFSPGFNPQYFTTDEPDYAPPEMPYSCCDIFIALLSMCSYIVDIGTDIWVASLHYAHGNYWWFALTLAFVLVPSFTMTCFSLAWYYQDHKERKEANMPPASRCRWLSRFLFHFLQLGPVMRYMDTVFYGVKSKKRCVHNQRLEKRHWYDQMLFEDADSCLLRLIECFMEAAPQLVLQLFILTKHGSEEHTLLVIGQVVSCMASLFSVSWSMVAYHRALRLSLDDKRNMTFGGMALQFFWHSFIIAARVLILALFAASFSFWVAVVVGAHWVVMLIWILYQDTRFCLNRCQEFWFNIVIACVYVFTYLNLIEGHTRLRYILYYCIVYFENFVMVITWYMFEHTEATALMPAAITVVLGGFLIGILFQVIYYTCFHPNNTHPVNPAKRIHWCLSCTELLNKPKVNFSTTHIDQLGSPHSKVSYHPYYPTGNFPVSQT